jgi:serralysin
MPFRVGSGPFTASGNALIDGVLWGGWRWDSPNLTYSFPTKTSHYASYGSGITGFKPFNDVQQAAAKGVLKSFAAVCGIEFKAASGPNGNIRFGNCTTVDYFDGQGPHTPGNTSAEANPPDPWDFPSYAQGDTWYYKSDYAKPKKGNFAYTAGIMHEVGHTLGLKHGHQGADFKNSNGQTFSLNALPSQWDSQEFTVMTYRRYVGENLGVGGKNLLQSDYPQTPMMLDILALQYLYGADYSTNAGNTTYKWDTKTGAMSINGKSQGATFHG